MQLFSLFIIRLEGFNEQVVYVAISVINMSLGRVYGEFTYELF